MDAHWVLIFVGAGIIYETYPRRVLPTHPLRDTKIDNMSTLKMILNLLTIEE